MDVLIVCPTHDRLFAPTMRSIFSLRGVGGRLDVWFPWQGYGDGTRDSRDIIADKYNVCRERMLSGGYDAMLAIESDMIVPPDALEKLAAAEADIAYGLYVFRRAPWHWSAYSVLDGMVGYPLSRAEERARVDWGAVIDVDGVGLGCTLIRRHVLEAIPFRSEGDTHPDGKRSHCDWYFANDCVDAGFTSKCDTSVRCGHITPCGRDGGLAPSVIWPDITAPEFCRFDEFAYD